MERFYEQLLRRVIDWGFRKLKLDLYYGPRRLMIDNLNLFADIARQLDPGLEIEGHISDPAVSAACAVVRTNDVLVNPGMDWRSVTSAHFRICQWSSPHRIINHDFIGGNDPNVTEADFRSHGLMFAQQPPRRGYACIGLLPDRFSLDTQQWLGRLIRDLHPPMPTAAQQLRAAVQKGMDFLTCPTMSRMSGVMSDPEESYGSFAVQSTGFAGLSLAEAITPDSVFNI